jgi:O-antigen ligase
MISNSVSDARVPADGPVTPTVRTPAGLLLMKVMFGAFYLFLASEFFSIAVNSLMLGLMALAWALIMIVERRIVLVRTPFDWFFLAYLIVQAAATAFSQDPAQSLLFSKRLLLIGIVYFVATWITSETLAKRTMAVLLGAAVAVAIWGGIKLLIAPPGEIVRLGIFQFYMTTSELMMISFLMLLPFAVVPGVPRTVRVAALIGIVPLLVALYATVTRGPLIAAVAGTLVVALLLNRKLLMFLLAGIVLMLLVASPYVAGRLESITNVHAHDNLTRLMLWRIGLESFREHPLIGVGDIDLGRLIAEHHRPDDPLEPLGHMHNIVMQFLVTHGAVGLTVILAMFAAVIIAEARIYRRVRGWWFPRAAAAGSIAVFVGFQIAGLTEWTFGDQEIVILFWLSIGLALAVNALVPQEGDR